MQNDRGSSRPAITHIEPHYRRTRARNEPTPDDEAPAPELPEDYEPFNENERKTISDYKEAFNDYTTVTIADACSARSTERTRVDSRCGDNYTPHTIKERKNKNYIHSIG
eukprot:1907022-Amphidinium_carterae.3